MNTQRYIVVPGKLDGVHLGHQAMLSHAQQHASKHNLLVCALFFDPSPAYVIHGHEQAPLSHVSRRVELLKQAGAHKVVIERFNQRYAEMEPDTFIKEILIEHLGAAQLVVGRDYQFGRDGKGDIDRLNYLSRTLGFTLHVLDDIRHEDMRISSSAIREALSQGQVAKAAIMLGRYHEAEGTVVKGQQLARQLGWPTANIRLPQTHLPKDGVYTIVAQCLNEKHASGKHYLRGVANLGKRPSVDAGPALEAHLFDFDKHIYDQQLRIGFVNRLRDETRFDSLEALKDAIALDVKLARDLTKTIDPHKVTWL